jgi:DNA (cytosine-5)-methyltransferase 1
MAENGKRPIAIDLFAGAGCLSLGFEQAGFDVRAAVELDPIHCAAHEYNFIDAAPICGDVSTLSGSEIRIRAGLGRTPVDVVVGGAPCQGFSLIGKRALDDPRNRLVYHFARIVRELGARYFVFENVKGLTIGQHRQFLHEVIAEFEENGYSILLPYQVLNAAHFGVPQERLRLFLIGAKKGLPLPRYPNRITSPAGSEDDLLLSPGPTVWDAIGDLPEVEDYPSLLSSDSVKGRYRKGSLYALRLRGLAPDRENYSYRRAFNASLLTASLRAQHTKESQARFRRTRHGDTEPISRFLKLDPKGVCNTLRAGTATDRGAFTSPRPIHPYTPRCITVREAARLHSYPDWFRFHVTKWHGFRQIGNSVPPLLARAVGAEIVRALGVKAAKPRKVMRLGDEALLSLTMAEAAERYGVSATVIPKRIRRSEVTAVEDVRAAYG